MPYSNILALSQEMWPERKVKHRALALSNLMLCMEERRPFVQSRRISPKGIEEEVREVICGKKRGWKRAKGHSGNERNNRQDRSYRTRPNGRKSSGGTQNRIETEPIQIPAAAKSIEM
jgi:ribonuclease HI